MNDFIKALESSQAAPEILVYFRGSKEPAVYTAAIMDLLKTDPETMEILNAETGEIIFSRQ